MNTGFKACLMGAPLDTGNMGVTALGTSLIHLVLGEVPEAEISFFLIRKSPEPYCVTLGDRSVEIPVINCRLAPKVRPGEHVIGLLLLAAAYRMVPLNWFRKKLLNGNQRLKAIAEADFVGDIRGGDSFSDIYGLDEMIIGSLPSAIALLLGKDLVLLPQTYGPYKNWAARRLAGILLRKAKIILSRDEAGLRVVKELLGGNGSAGRLHFCPDVAFSLDPRQAVPLSFRPDTPLDRSVPIVGLNVSGLLYNGGFTRKNMFGLAFEYRDFVHRLAGTMLSETEASLLLVPHTFAPGGNVESDPAACEELFRDLDSRYPGRVHMVAREYGASEIKGIIGLCDFFVGSRMHACIGALSQGIPTVGVAYSRKFAGLFESVGAGHMVVDARNVEEGRAVETILAAFHRRAQEKTVLLERIRDVRTLLRGTFRELLAKERSG
jgi:polysaccharide pyruvyl transferase WcaK-like protein